MRLCCPRACLPLPRTAGRCYCWHACAWGLPQGCAMASALYLAVHKHNSTCTCENGSCLPAELTSGVAPPLAHLPQGCSSVLYFEARKHKDLYLWVAKSPSGPSVKFHVTNGERFLLVWDARWLLFRMLLVRMLTNNS